MEQLDQYDNSPIEQRRSALAYTRKLLRELGKESEEEQYCLRASEGLQKQLRRLSDEALNRLSEMLTAEWRKYKQERKLAMRRKFFAYCHKLNWTTEPGKLDYPRITAWLNKYGHLKKDINYYTYEELPQLLTQIENLWRTKQ